jgi:hypothetical protein
VNHKLIAACLISLAIVGQRAIAATITVTTTNDSGGGSLRAAIASVNSTPGMNFINFNIPGTGPFTITPTTALTNIMNPVVIDGYTQPGSSSNTLANADNAVLQVKIVGSILDLEASNSTIRGLVLATDGFAIQLGYTAPGCVVEGNFIGVDFDGITSASDTSAEGLVVRSSNNRIGGTSPGSRNIIAYHEPGIEVVQDTMTFFATNNMIQGNFIGVDITGLNPAPNGLNGVQISMAPTNTIGGTVPGAGNIIGNSQGYGVGEAMSYGDKVLGNSIFDNGEYGIQNNNNIVAAPILLAATNNATSTMIGVTLANTNTVMYRLEFFASPNCGTPPFFGQGKTLIGTTNVAGKTAFTIILPRVESTLFLTATATGPETSMFSDCIPIITPPGGLTNSWTNSVSGKWEGDFNWSLTAAPSTNQNAVLMTNAASKTATIDATTANFFTGTMTISNLTIGAPGVSINTLSVANAGTFTPLDVFSSCIVSNGGAMVFSNSTLQVDGRPSGVFEMEGPVTFNGGGLITSNTAATYIGDVGQGSLSLSNATLASGYTVVGGFSPGAQGTFSLVDATATLYALMEVCDNATSTGTLWLANSFLEIEGPVYLGFLGSGQMTASNSTVDLDNGLDMASQTGSHATYTSVNTTNTFGDLVIGEDGIASVTLIGGQTTVGGIPIYVGEYGIGQLTLSNTTLISLGISLGVNSGSAGQLTFAGGSMVLSNLTVIGTAAGATSTVLVTGGQLIMTNTPTTISASSLSQVTVSNGTLQVGALTVIPSATAGTLTVAGGNLNIGDLFDCSSSTGTALWLTGGQVTATNENSLLGQMAMSNGTFLASDVFVGGASLGGTITMAGGTFEIVGGADGLIIGGNGYTGTLWNTGGHLITPNKITYVGGLFSPAVGSIIASNGTTQAGTVYLGAQSDGAGTFTIAGGIHSIYSSLVLGGDLCVGGTGVVTVTGGELFVTNAAHNAVLDVETGTLTVNGGYVQADIIILSNSCAYYTSSGGQVVYGSAVLNPNVSLVGDGIPNSWKQQYGLDAFDPNLANEDTDGDGMNNLDEYLTGTNPTNSASYFHIVSVTRETNNMRVKWTTQGGHTNRVYVSTGAAGGGYTNNFGNLSPFIIIPGTGASTTNYLDVGGATNGPGRYYHIGQIP